MPVLVRNQLMPVQASDASLLAGSVAVNTVAAVRQIAVVTPEAAQQPVAHPRKKLRQAWLVLHLPDWSLQSWLRFLPDAQRAALQALPVAVLDVNARVMCRNALAAAQGVRVGDAMHAALSVCASLQVLRRDPVKEQQALQWLANWALQFTPLIQVMEHNQLLLEVRGSFRLFGGPSALLQRVQQALQQEQLQAVLMLGPTARASSWLARQAAASWSSATHREMPEIVVPTQLRSRLAGVALRHTQWPEALLRKLQRFGLHQVGELWRLPRAELMRRIGCSAMRELDAALGREVELQQLFVTLPQYRQRHVLDYELCSVSELEQLLRQWLVPLQHWLRQRDLTMATLRVVLEHRATRTPLTIALAAPTMELTHLQQVLHERLNTLVLPSPVLAVRLQVTQLFAAAGTTRDAWSTDGQSDPQMMRGELYAALDRIRARLGMHAVQLLQTHADHRPERAQGWLPLWQANRAIHADTSADLPERPVWLLPVPELLGRDTLPPASFTLLHGPERIETGWWDEQPVQRDYYQALQGVRRCWLYRDRQQHGWYLHGWFG